MPGPGEARDTKSATTKWPGGNSNQPLRFYAPEGLRDVQGVTPATGVQGVGEYGRGASILSPPLGGSLVSFCPGRKKLAPQGEIPLRTTNAVRNRPLIRLASLGTFP